MSTHNNDQKNKIYYSRTYRHFKSNGKKRWLFLLLWVLPCLIMFLFFYTKITYYLSLWAKEALSHFVPFSDLTVDYSMFLPVFGGVYYLQVPTSLPFTREIEINVVITLILLFILFFVLKGKRGGTPFSIYFIIILLIHLVACIVFMFAMEYFPYTASQYSELYILQQVGIWISMILLSGLIAGAVGYGVTLVNILYFIFTMTYSFIFGCVRYLAFLFIITEGSSLYMTTLFFALGPLYDFLYFVFIYSVYVNIHIISFDEGKRRGKWQWM